MWKKKSDDYYDYNDTDDTVCAGDWPAVLHNHCQRWIFLFLAVITIHKTKMTKFIVWREKRSFKKASTGAEASALPNVN